jgi:hypothetical protein
MAVSFFGAARRLGDSATPDLTLVLGGSPAVVTGGAAFLGKPARNRGSIAATAVSDLGS